MEAKISQLTATILHEIFVTEKAHEGFLLQLLKDGPATTVRFNLSVILGDEEALNQMFFSKGASGVMPCMLCCVTNKAPSTDRDRGIASLHDRDAMIPDLSCHTLAQCGKKSDADIWKSVDKLRSGCSQSEVAEEEHLSGLKFNAHSILFCAPLRPHIRPASLMYFDAMHVIFSNGVLPQEMSLCLHEMKDQFGIFFLT